VALTTHRAETSSIEAGVDTGPIARMPLHDAIVTRLRDMIIEGVLAPGSRVNEGQVGAQLGISRTPLREAIKFLASEGLIELAPGRGAIVRKFSKKDVSDMLVVLRSQECLAGKLACENATDEAIAEIRQLHDEMIAHYQARRRLAYYKLNQEIHSAIVRLADNEFLVYVHGVLQSRLKRIRFIGHEGEANWAKAVAEHEEIILALEARDSGRLLAILDQHLSGAWERVQDVI
jgi:DNA-binding GntR family transcriptional regulator